LCSGDGGSFEEDAMVPRIWPAILGTFLAAFVLDLLVWPK
jgi:hypothetical protein